MPLQLGLGLNRRLGGFNPFTPNHLNPYLLFDTQTSMLGELESPTLDLDPATPSTLDVITATRSGVATYTDADGLIQTAPENTVRVDHVDGVPMMLIEPSATNLVNDSTSFTTGLDITQETGIDAPDGTNTATRLTGIQAASGERSLAVASSVTPSAEITGSVYLRGTAGEVISTYTKRQGAGAFVASSRIDVTLTGDWQRLDGMTLTLNADNNQASIAIVNSLEATADVVDVWGAQIEEGAVATSFIPTSGSTVTRAADNLVIDGSAFSDFYNQSEGTVYIELTSEDDGKNSYPVYFTQDVAGYAERNNGTWVIQKDGIPNVYLASWANGGFVSNSLISLGSYTAGNSTRVSVSYDSNSYEGSKDGASVQTSTPTTMATTLVDRLFVGGSGIFQNSSRIKRLIYWPTHSSRL